MTVEAVSGARKCRLCGYVGLDVAPGVHRLSTGTFRVIDKCEDHAACEKRRPPRAS